MTTPYETENSSPVCEFSNDYVTEYSGLPTDDFQYDALRDGTKEIRLLKLLPDLVPISHKDKAGILIEEGSIQATLEHVQLLDDTGDIAEDDNGNESATGVKYHALSYVWGDTANKVPIVLNGYRMLITDNLFAGLRRIWIRTFQETTSLNATFGFGYPLWVDAICINQDDDSEKSQQVQRMGSIYRQAARVCIWLGVETEWCVSAASNMFILDLRQGVNFNPIQPGKDGIQHLSDLDDWLADDTKRKELFYWLDTLLDSLASEDFHGLESILQLAELPWWQRAWVCQEVALSDVNQAGMLWGKELLSWANVVNGSHTLSMMSYLIVNNRDWPKLLEWDWSKIRLLRNVSVMFDQFISFVMDSTQPTLAEMIPRTLFRSAAATLDVDHIYSLLGIASDSSTCGIVPDYSSPASTVFQQVAVYLLDHVGATTLTYVELCNTTGMNLPSWVPNFTISGFMSLSIPVPRPLRRRIYGAGGDTNLFSYQVKGTTLQVHGLLHDTISKLMAEVLDDETIFDPPQWHTAATWLQHFHSFIQDHRASINELFLPELWRLPIGNQTSQHIVDLHGATETSLKENYDSLRSRCSGQDISVSESVYLASWNIAGQRRTPFITANGYIGLGPPCARQGDQVCIVLGADTPSILRAAENDSYRIVGEGYVLGIMDGEALSDMDSLQELTII